MDACQLHQRSRGQEWHVIVWNGGFAENVFFQVLFDM